MISIIRKILEIHDFYGISKNIDIAKGLYKTPMKVKEGYKRHKRQKWQT